MKLAALTQPFSRRGRAGMVALALSGALLAGCAGNPPKEQFAVTEAAIRSATTAEATKFAPLEMQQAREHWRQAELEMEKQNYDKARRLAERAEIDARLAERKARAVKTQRALEQAQEGIRLLREETQRGGGY